MDVAMVGLGRMGGNMARRLVRGGHRVVVWNRTFAKAQELESEGAEAVPELREVVAASCRSRGSSGSCCPTGRPPRTPSTSWCRCSPKATSSSTAATRPSRTTSGAPKPSSRRASATSTRAPAAASGACRWATASWWAATAARSSTSSPSCARWRRPDTATSYMGGHGSGHFVKMVHNGIEYGMMQAYAEGFELLEATELRPRPGRHRRPVEPGQRGALLAAGAGRRRLQEGPGLEQITGYVDDTGEGRWTVEQAIEHGVPMPAIAESLFARFRSRQTDTVLGQGAGRPAQRVRRPRRGGEEVTARRRTPRTARHVSDAQTTTSMRIEPARRAEPAPRHRPSAARATRSPAASSSSASPATSPAASSCRPSTTWPATACCRFGFSVVGYGRKPMTDEEFRDLLREAIDGPLRRGHGRDVALCERILLTPRLRAGRVRRPGRLPAPRRRCSIKLDREQLRAATASSTWPRRRSLFPVIVARLGRGRAGARRRLRRGARPGRAGGPAGRASWSRSPSASDLAQRPRAQRHHAPRPSTSGRSTASTTTWPRRRCRTSWSFALPTASSSPSGTGATSTTCRSRRPRRWASSTAAPTTKRPAPCATWSRPTCCSSSR